MLRRHEGRRCPDCGRRLEWGEMLLCGETATALSTCRHVLRQIDVPPATGEIVVQLGDDRWS